MDKIDKKFEFVEEELNKMDSTMKRITKYINFFSRHYMGDKIIVGCICIILIIILVIFILMFAKKSGISIPIDQLNK